MQPNPALFTLQIAALPCGRGMLGLTFCPGINPDDEHTRNRGGPHAKPRTTPHLSALIRDRSMAGGVGWLPFLDVFRTRVMAAERHFGAFTG